MIESHRIRPRPGLDIKVAWKAGRMQRMTDPEREVEDFMAANPVGYGVHWVSAMEVALRVANWVRAGVTGPHVKAHGEWIRGHLEPGHRNHFLANVVGLLFVDPSDRWARDQLVAEVRHQFHPEGSDFEGSTAYHRFAYELAAWGASLVTVPDDVLTRLALARRFTEVMGPAVIGDDGDDRLFLDADPAIDLPEAIPSEALAPSLSRRGFSFTREYRFAAPMRGVTLHAYPAFGVYVMRNERTHLAIRCGPRGQLGKGGHDHDDQLSITLSVDGRDIVRDPGTFAYTGDPDARNRYRCARVHFAPHAEGPDPGRLDRLWHLPGPDGVACRFDERGFEGYMPLTGGRVVGLRVDVDGDGITVVHGANVPLVDTQRIRWSPAYGVLSDEWAPVLDDEGPREPAAALEDLHAGIPEDVGQA